MDVVTAAPDDCLRDWPRGFGYCGNLCTTVVCPGCGHAERRRRGGTGRWICPNCNDTMKEIDRTGNRTRRKMT